MEFGIFDHVERKPDEPLAGIYRERRTLAKLAEQAGCFCYHVSEHHGTPLAMAPSPNILLAALAADTDRIHIGPLGALLPLYQPLRLLEEICMLDQLSNGRLELGIGRGVSPIEQRFYNVDVAQSRAMFDEALEILQRGFTEKVLDFSGEFYDYDNVPVELTTVQQPHPPIWYPTSNVNSVAMVAKNGWNTVFPGELSKIAGQVATYKENIDPALLPTARYGVHPFVVVAPTDAEAMEAGESSWHAHHANLSYLREWHGRTGSMTRQQNLRAPATLAEAVESGWAAVGSPHAVQDQLGRIFAETGANYLLCSPLAGNASLEFAARSLELLAGEVLTAL